MPELTRPSRILGKIEPIPTLTGTLTTAKTISGTVSKYPVKEVEFLGPYVVNPTFDEQVLDTDSKLMTADVTVKPIAVSRTSNLSGGITVFIGGLE